MLPNRTPHTNPFRRFADWFTGGPAWAEGPDDTPPNNTAPTTNNQYRSLQQLDSRMRSITAELKIIDAIQEPSEEDISYQGTLIEEYDGIETKAQPLRERMAKLAAIAQAAVTPDNVEPPRTGLFGHQSPEMFVRSRIDPLADIDRVVNNLVLPDDLRARAATLIEQDEKHRDINHDYAEIAYARSQGLGIGDSRSGIAKHILLTGSREYREAFRTYLEDPLSMQPGVLRDEKYRAINLTSASGGFLLPYVLDPTIVLTNNASANPFRRISRVVQTTSNAWQGVNSAGITGAWVAEATTAADMSPTVGQIQIVPEKGVVWVLGSYEALDDTNFGEQLPGLLSDARDRMESAAFTTGAGSGSGLPLGILAALGSASRVAPGATGTAFAGTASISDVYNLQAALPPRFRNAPGAAFLANIKVMNAVRAIDVYGGGSFWANLTSSTPPSLLGQPIYEGSDMPAALTGTSALTGTGSATLTFGDFGQFIIADRVGVSMLYDPMIKGSTNAQLPSGNAGWYMFWRTGSAVSSTAAFRYLTIS